MDIVSSAGPPLLQRSLGQTVGCRVFRLPARSANLNAFAGRWVRSVGAECRMRTRFAPRRRSGAAPQAAQRRSNRCPRLSVRSSKMSLSRPNPASPPNGSEPCPPCSSEASAPSSWQQSGPGSSPSFAALMNGPPTPCPPDVSLQTEPYPAFNPSTSAFRYARKAGIKPSSAPAPTTAAM